MSDQTNQFLDLASAPVLREGKAAIDGAMTPEQAAAYQRGDIALNEPAAPPPPAPAPADTAPASPASAAPAAPAIPTNQPAPDAPPVTPNDSGRVQARINKLFAQKKGAEELVEQQATRIADLERRLNEFAVAQPHQVPANQYDYSQYNPGAVNGGGTPEQALSPEVIAHAIDQRMQAWEQRQAQLAALQSAQNASRAEAEGDYPDVFSSPDVRSTFETILANDPSLATDPRGPYKAAVMARGFQDPLSGTGQVSPDARKQAISGVGPSVAEGSQNPSDLHSQYRAALTRAQQTGRDSDYVRAYQIRDAIARAAGG